MLGRALCIGCLTRPQDNNPYYTGGRMQLVRHSVSLLYSPWRSPRTQTMLLILAVAAGLSWGYLRIADDAETRLAVLGAGVAATIAVWGVANQWAISRRQLTIQFIRELETDKEYAEALALFNAAAAHNSSIRQYALAPPRMKDALYQEWIKTAAAIALILNQDEIISIGVRNSILDYRLLCTWARTAYIRRYDRAKPYIETLQTEMRTPTMFSEFARFAERLRADDVHLLLAKK